MASDDIVVLYSEEEEEIIDRTACKFVLEQREPRNATRKGMIQASINKGTEDVYKPRWQWYESLSFLTDHMRIRPSNLAETSGRLEPINDSIPVAVVVQERPVPREVQEVQTLPKPTKKARLSAEEEWTPDEATTLATHPKQPSYEQDVSDDMIWAEQMGRSIQKIKDEELKEWLKLEIQQMIIRTRFKKPQGSFNTEFQSVSG